MIAEELRSKTLSGMAFKLRSLDFEAAEILATLRAVNRNRCEPLVSEAELLMIVIRATGPAREGKLKPITAEAWRLKPRPMFFKDASFGGEDPSTASLVVDLSGNVVAGGK